MTTKKEPTNQQRAAELLGKVRYERSRLATPDMIEWFARDAYREVSALADADLLAPDLPRADKDGWWWPDAPIVGNVHRTTLHGVRSIVLQGFGGQTAYLTPAEASDLADVLNAAARAEQGPTDV